MRSKAMLSTKPVGRGAASRKYDLLTAMGAYALARDKYDQRRVLRLMTLMTARYNWSLDSLSVGQREIARLWAVDERTVKREMARLRAMGWLVVKRQGARGRVTDYSIDIPRILEDTRDTWQAVGPDFDLRMGGQGAEDTTVVPMPLNGTAPKPDITDDEWGLTQALLHSADEALYGSWIHALQKAERTNTRLTLRAPSRFHAAYVQTHLERRILQAVRDIDDTITELRIIT